MTSKITDAAADILAKLTSTRDRIARDQREVADLERRATWARGQERRDRLSALADEAQQLADGSGETGAALRDLVRELAQVARRVQEASTAHNASLGSVVARLREEKVPVHSGTPTPSPAHAMVAPTDRGGIAIRRHRINPVDADQLIAAALVTAKSETGAVLDADRLAGITAVSSEVPDYSPNIRFYIHPENKSVYAYDHEPAAASGLVPIGRREYLCRVWGVELDSLPDDLFPTA